MITKKIWILSFLIAAVLAATVIASGTVYTLTKGEKNVETNVGFVTLHQGTLVGGDPYDYIYLTKATFLQTNQGEILFPIGTKVDCDVPPGHPDPCDPY